MNSIRRLTATFMILMLTLLQAPVLQAAMVSTGEALQVDAQQADRARLITLLEKEELRQQLQLYGIDPAVAVDRVSHLSDSEIATLHRQLDQLPAGEGVLGLAVLLFVVFIVTDALGATDIFTFVKPINR